MLYEVSVAPSAGSRDMSSSLWEQKPWIILAVRFGPYFSRAGSMNRDKYAVVHIHATEAIKGTHFEEIGSIWLLIMRFLRVKYYFLVRNRVGQDTCSRVHREFQGKLCDWRYKRGN